jgi:hypothetical protein
MEPEGSLPSSQELSTNTCGYREISIKLLKISSAYITSPLNHICNTSLLSGAFPQLVKEQFGFKTNVRTEKANYELSNEILEALNNILLVGEIFMA